MKKKILAFCIVLCMLFSLAVVPAGAEVIEIVESGTCGADGDNLTWTLKDCGRLLTISGTGNMANYAPYYSDNTPPWIYSYYHPIETVIIENGVTSIGEYAFDSCSELTSITIPSSVTDIGGHAFCDCWELSSCTLHNSIISIGEYAFHGCSSLSYFDVPNSVTSIGECAFYACASLTSIDIPDSVISIGEWAFCACENLTSINVSESNQNYSSQDGVLFNKDKTRLIQCPAGKTDAYIIPDSVISIGALAFYVCKGLTGVTIPNSVTSIGEDAFYFCTGLTDVTIPNSVTSIENGGFYGCTNLTSITIPNSVTSLGYGAFSDCKSLTSVTIGNHVASIGTGTFSNCSNLVSITIPNSVTSIGIYAFNRCYKLTDIWYSGNEYDWSEISIGAYNDKLTKATIHYTSPYSARVINGNIVLQAQIKDAVSDENLHMAIYSENNTLLDYIIVPQFGEFREVNVVFHDIPEAKYAKVFLWSSLSSLEPIAEAEKVSIIREE